MSSFISCVAMAAHLRIEMKQARLCAAQHANRMFLSVLKMPDYELPVFREETAALMLLHFVDVLMRARWDSRRLCCSTKRRYSTTL